MSTELLNDSCPAQRVRSQIHRRLKMPTFTNSFTAVQVGSDPASTRYIKHKQRDCEKVHLHSEVHRLPTDINQETFTEYIEALTVQPDIHRMLVQTPLLDGIDKDSLLNGSHATSQYVLLCLLLLELGLRMCFCNVRDFMRMLSAVFRWDASVRWTKSSARCYF